MINRLKNKLLILILIMFMVTILGYKYSDNRIANTLFGEGEFSSRVMPIAKNKGLTFIEYLIHSDRLKGGLMHSHRLIELLCALDYQDIQELEQWSLNVLKGPSSEYVMIAALTVQIRLEKSLAFEIDIQKTLSKSNVGSSDSIVLSRLMLATLYYKDDYIQLLGLFDKAGVASDATYRKVIATGLAPHANQEYVRSNLIRLLKIGKVGDEAINLLATSMKNKEMVKVISEFEDFHSNRFDMNFECVPINKVYSCGYSRPNQQP